MRSCVFLLRRLRQWHPVGDDIIVVDDPIRIIVNNVYFIPALLDPIAIFFFVIFGVAFVVLPIVIIR